MPSNANHTPIAGAQTPADTLTDFNTALEALDAALNTKLLQSLLNIAIFRNEQTSGTNAGSSAAATWNERTFTTVVNSGYTFYTTSSNKFTPEAGVYLLYAMLPAYTVGLHKARLYNVSQALIVDIGMVAKSPAGRLSITNAHLFSIFTANGTDEYRIEHYTESAVADTGLGIANSITSVPEIYELFMLWKVQSA